MLFHIPTHWLVDCMECIAAPCNSFTIARRGFPDALAILDPRATSTSPHKLLFLFNFWQVRAKNSEIGPLPPLSA